MNDILLPSWRPGPAREALLAFLETAMTVPMPERLACFDVDGTLWCERPTYVQYDFLVDALRDRVTADPAVAERAEFAAVLGGDHATIREFGLVRIAFALLGLFEGVSPDTFTAQARQFMATATNDTLGRALRHALYHPMLELMDELRTRGFTIALVTGGGTEFVRAISLDVFGVPPEAVVGTLIGYDDLVDAEGRPALLRSGRLQGEPNEGVAKVRHIQHHLGRRPMLAAGNSGGDLEMLEWARSGDRPSLALLIEHDDGDREFAYASVAGTFAQAEPITDVGRRLGWTMVSMRHDWHTVF